MSQIFVRKRGSSTKSGSTNETFFGSINGKEGNYVRRRMQPAEMTADKLENAKKERTILIRLNQTNLSNTYGRTMIPQNLAINADGTASITQTLYPFRLAHRRDKFFPLNDLRAQNVSMLEAIEYLHTPKQITLENGQIAWVSVVHRDLKAENLLQQSKTDFRAAVTDFDLSEIQISNTQQGMKANIERRLYTKRAGTPDTLDPNIYFKDPPEFSFRELMASDVWSIGITMMQNTFGTRLFDRMMRFNQDTTVDKVQRTYRAGVTKRIRKYFDDRDNAQILKENPRLVENQVKNMRKFLNSKDFEILEQDVLRTNWTHRKPISEVLSKFRALQTPDS